MRAAAMLLGRSVFVWARRIAANIAKLPELLRPMSRRMLKKAERRCSP
jgi:hypothetical protein